VASSQEWLGHFYFRKPYYWWNDQNLTRFNLEKLQYLPHYWSDKDFKCTVVNRALSYLYGSLILFKKQTFSSHNVIKANLSSIKLNWKQVKHLKFETINFSPKTMGKLFLKASFSLELINYILICKNLFSGRLVRRTIARYMNIALIQTLRWENLTFKFFFHRVEYYVTRLSGASRPSSI